AGPCRASATTSSCGSAGRASSRSGSSTWWCRRSSSCSSRGRPREPAPLPPAGGADGRFGADRGRAPEPGAQRLRARPYALSPRGLLPRARRASRLRRDGRARPPALHRLSRALRAHLAPPPGGHRGRGGARQEAVMTPPLAWYLGLSAVLFAIGVLGVLIRRNVIVIFMAI